MRVGFVCRKSLKRKWEMCLSEHGRGSLSHSFPHKGMGEALLGSFRRVYVHSVEQKEWTGFFAPKDFPCREWLRFFQARFTGSFLRSGRSFAPPNIANPSHLGIEQIWKGGLVLAGLSSAHWGGVLGSFQQYWWISLLSF